MNKILPESFFNRDTKLVAKELIGKFLVRKQGNQCISGMIVETEAYDGFRDQASHAFSGKTKRTEVMFGNPGVFYVYLCYGMYFMLNVVARESGYPAAVLIRAIILHDSKIDLNGPGKLTKFLKIDGQFNNKKTSIKTGLWIEDKEKKIKKSKIQHLPRVGVSYAGPVWSKRKFRFIYTP